MSASKVVAENPGLASEGLRKDFFTESRPARSMSPSTSSAISETPEVGFVLYASNVSAILRRMGLGRPRIFDLNSSAEMCWMIGIAVNLRVTCPLLSTVNNPNPCASRSAISSTWLGWFATSMGQTLYTEIGSCTLNSAAYRNRRICGYTDSSEGSERTVRWLFRSNRRGGFQRSFSFNF